MNPRASKPQPISVATPTVPSLEDVFKAQQIALEAEKAILNKIPVSVESHGVMPLKEKDKMSVF